MKHFFSYYQNPYGHQTLQSGHMLRGAVTHKYERHLNGVVLRGQIHSEPANDVLTPHKARCWLSASGSQTWAFDQVTNARSVWKIYIFYFYNVYS